MTPAQLYYLRGMIECLSLSDQASVFPSSLVEAFRKAGWQPSKQAPWEFIDGMRERIESLEAIVDGEPPAAPRQERSGHVTDHLGRCTPPCPACNAENYSGEEATFVRDPPRHRHVTNIAGDCVPWCPACGPKCKHGYNSLECEKCDEERTKAVWAPARRNRR